MTDLEWRALWAWIDEQARLASVKQRPWTEDDVNTDWDRSIAGAVLAAHAWRVIGDEVEAAKAERWAAAYRVLRAEGEKR